MSHHAVSNLFKFPEITYFLKSCSTVNEIYHSLHHTQKMQPASCSLYYIIIRETLGWQISKTRLLSLQCETIDIRVWRQQAYKQIWDQKYLEWKSATRQFSCFILTNYDVIYLRASPRKKSHLKICLKYIYFDLVKTRKNYPLYIKNEYAFWRMLCLKKGNFLFEE